MHKPLESLLIALLTFQIVILIWYREQSPWMITIVGALLIWFAFYEWDLIAKKKRFLQSFMRKWDPEKKPTTSKSAPTGSALNKARKKSSIDLKKQEESVKVAVIAQDSKAQYPKQRILKSTQVVYNSIRTIHRLLMKNATIIEKVFLTLVILFQTTMLLFFREGLEQMVSFSGFILLGYASYYFAKESSHQPVAKEEELPSEVLIAPIKRENNQLTPKERLLIWGSTVLLNITIIILLREDLIPLLSGLTQFVLLGFLLGRFVRIEKLWYRRNLSRLFQSIVILLSFLILTYNLFFGTVGWLSNPNFPWVLWGILIQLLFSLIPIYHFNRDRNSSEVGVPFIGYMFSFCFLIVAAGAYLKLDFVVNYPFRFIALLLSLGTTYLWINAQKLKPRTLRSIDEERERQFWGSRLSKVSWRYGALVSIIVVLFISFGAHHLGQFMSVDEPKWVNTRVPQLFEALSTGDWEATYINDKPGVLPSLLSGPVNLFLDHDEYEADSLKYETYLFWWRLPIVLFSALMLFFVYHFSKPILKRDGAVLLTLLIATNPVVLGITQVVNPDATLWSVSFLAFLTFFLYLRSDQRKYLYYSAFFFGLGLISKYFIAIFFILFFVAIYVDYVIYNRSIKVFYQRCIDFLVLSAVAISIYTLLFPVNWVRPQQIFIGTIGSDLLTPGIRYILIFVALIFFEMIVFKGRIVKYIHSKLNIIRLISVILGLGFISLFIFLITNLLLENAFFDYNNYLSFEFVRGEVNIVNDFIASSYITLMTYTPILLAGIVLSPIVFLKKNSQLHLKINQNIMVSTILLLTIFLVGATLGGYLADARYQIMLYPPISILTVLVFQYLSFENKYVYAIISIISFTTLFHSAPFYHHYNNFLNINDYVITTEWGFGGYELAQIVNQKPNAKELNVWTDREGFHEFFVGQEPLWRGSTNPFDSSKEVDYLVLTNRGEQMVMRALDNYEQNDARYLLATVAGETPLLEYYKRDPEHQICIHDNPLNCFKLIKVDSEDRVDLEPKEIQRVYYLNETDVPFIEGE